MKALGWAIRAGYRWLEGPRGTSSVTFESLLANPEDASTGLKQLAELVNQRGGTYHKLDFGFGVVFDGEYDMRRYLHAFALPESLSGVSVLDVGTSSGFLALECARRGASRVVAVDVFETPLLRDISPYLSFGVEYRKLDVYRLEELREKFDMVICGSLLLHLPDVVMALKAIRRVCKDRLTVSTACPVYSAFLKKPVCEFRGKKAEDGDYYHFWELSGEALANMLRIVGFREVSSPQYFLLESEKGKKKFATPHVVVTSFV